MATSLETPSPTTSHKPSNLQASSLSMGSPLLSPSSDRRFWSSLRSRIDALLEDRSSNSLSGKPHLAQINSGDSGRAKRFKEDTLLLMRGFDSVAHTLSQLSSNLDTALQGAKDLAKPPTLTEIFHRSLKNSERREDESGKQDNGTEEETDKGLKRKYDISHCPEQHQDEDSKNSERPRDDPKDGKLKKAKNLAVSMATKAASLARELKSIKSDLCFVQERCSLLEEENGRLREGFAKGIRPEEDDLVRLQLEALLAEKSRLANENANLIRENQCLNQLVEYHQLTSQDLSASEYEQVLQGMCLDFSSPMPQCIPEEDRDQSSENPDAECFQTPSYHLYNFSDALNE